MKVKISKRTEKILDKAGIRFWQLTDSKYSKNRLLKIRGLGLSAYQELKLALDDLGLDFGIGDRQDLLMSAERHEEIAKHKRDKAKKIRKLMEDDGIICLD